MTSPTTYYGWLKPSDGGDVDEWGVENNTVIDNIDAQVHANALAAALLAGQAAPTGMIAAFDLAAAPAGWIAANGQTIGDASSGAGRANADTAALFAAQWAFSNTLRPILNSDGSAGTRGASAAADFAAHKRIPVGNIGNRVLRGIGADAPALGDTQEDALKSHTHTYTLPKAGGSTPSQPIISDSENYTNESHTTGAPSTDGGTPPTETRVKGYGVLWCIKL
jgi:hypothetical protein